MRQIANLSKESKIVIVSTNRMKYDSTTTHITLAEDQGIILPDPSISGSYDLAWWNSTDYLSPIDDPFVEIVRCIAKVDSSIIVVRSQQETLASPKNIENKTYRMALLSDNINIPLCDNIPYTLSYYNIPQIHDNMKHSVAYQTASDVTSAIGAHTDLTVAHGSNGNVVGQTTLDAHINNTTTVHGLGTISTQAANNVSITGGSISGLTTDLAVADGGTGASTAPKARDNLGLGTLAEIQVVASNDIRYSNDVEMSGFEGVSWSLLKTITLTSNIKGTYRISYDGKEQCQGTAYFNIYRNGAAFGTVRGTSINWQTWTEDFSTTLYSGDTIEIWGYHDYGVGGCLQLANFRIKYKLSIPLAVVDGGTGSSDIPTIKTNLGLGSISAQSASNIQVTGGTVTGLVNTTGVMKDIRGSGIASDTVIQSYDTEVTGYGLYTVYTLSQCVMTLAQPVLGGVRISFDYHGSGGSPLMAVMLYRNGAAFGSGWSTDSQTYVTVTEDFTNVKWGAGDVIQVYCWSQYTGTAVYFRNLRIKQTVGSLYYEPGITDVPIADGGTGASTAAAARLNLGSNDVNGRMPMAQLPTKILNSYWHASIDEVTVVQGSWGMMSTGPGQSDYDISLVGGADTGYFNSHTDGDEVHFGSLTLNAGTYKISASCKGTSNSGIMEILHGTTSLGTKDLYVASYAFNIIASFTYSPTSRVTGNLRVKTSGKNASAYDYSIAISRLEIIRTG